MRRGLALAASSGALYAACLPPLGLWPLAFVALAPLVAAARTTTVGRAALLGWVAGSVATAAGTTPALTAGAAAYFGQGTLWAFAFATVLGQVFLALPAAAFGAMAARVSGRRVPVRIVATAAAWAGLELLRAHALTGTGSPWAMLAHALHEAPLWIQLADLGGTYAVSFVLAGTAAALAELRAAPRVAVATLATLLVAPALYGAWRLHAERDGGPVLPVAMVQGDLSAALRRDPARTGEALRVLTDATRAVLPAKPALVVWPENAVGLLPGTNASVAATVRATLGDDGPPLLFGAPRAVQDEPGRVRVFNSAYLLAPDGDTLAVYDKRRLVPFAEYRPGVAAPRPGDYTAGDEATLFTAPVPFGVLICFEGIYGDLARDLVRRGARLLVNVSNDAWFDGSTGRDLAFAMTVFRAVETRRSLVRVANTGVTGVVGPSGRVLARFPAGVRGAWTVAVPLRDGAPTPYVRFGDVFGWLALGFAAASCRRAR